MEGLQLRLGAVAGQWGTAERQVCPEQAPPPPEIPAASPPTDPLDPTLIGHWTGVVFAGRPDLRLWFRCG